MTRKSIFLLESQPIVIRGLQIVISETEDLSISGIASAPSEALDAMRAAPADAILVDANPGLRPALRFISDLSQIAPGVQPVLWASSLSEMDASRMLQLGARGVARKSLPIDRLLECVRTVAQGGIWLETDESEPDSSDSRRAKSLSKLTPREREVAVYVCRGLRNREIAEHLSITPGTVKVHLMHIFEKTGMKDRFEVAIHGRSLLGVETPAFAPALTSEEPGVRAG